MENNRVKLKDTMQEAVIKMAEGNPGAARVLTELAQKEEGLGFLHRLFFTSSANILPPVPGFRLPGLPARGVGHNSFFGDIFNISYEWHIWPVLIQYLLAIGIVFYHQDCLKASPFSSKVYATYTSE